MRRLNEAQVKALSGTRKCQYCWKEFADETVYTRNGRRWKCNTCRVNAATKKPHR